MEQVESEEKEERQFHEDMEQTSESNLRDLSEVRCIPFMNLIFLRLLFIILVLFHLVDKKSERNLLTQILITIEAGRAWADHTLHGFEREPDAWGDYD